MGNQASGEVLDGPWPRARGGGRGPPCALPPMVLAVEEVLWRGTSTVPEGMVSQIDIVPWIDDVQVPHGANFPPGPIWVEPRSSHSVLTLQLSPRPELGELARRELTAELLLPFDRLVDLGAPLFTSLVLGLPFGGGSTVTINQAIQSACDPAVPKVLLTLFRPQLPWAPGGGRPHPDIQGAVAVDGEIGSCIGSGAGTVGLAGSLVEQVGGVIQAIRVANETTLHLQAASAEEADEASGGSAAVSWPATSRCGTPCGGTPRGGTPRGVVPERISMWCYKGTDGAPLGIRAQAQVDAERTGAVLIPGEVFGVSQERRGADGVTYLLLADGRGWAFDSKPGVGLLCAREAAAGDDTDPAWTHGPTLSGTASTASESTVFSAIAELILSLSRRQESGKLSESEARAREALILSQLVLQGPDMKLSGVDPEALGSLRACAVELAQDLASVGGIKPKQLVQELQKVTKAKQALEVEGARRVEEAQAELRAREEGWQAELAALQSKALAELRARDERAQAELRSREEDWQAELARLQSQVAHELADREGRWREELSRLVAEEQRSAAELEASRGRDRQLQAELEASRGRERQLQGELERADAERVELEASRGRERQLQAELERASAERVELEASRGRELHLQGELGRVAEELATARAEGRGRELAAARAEEQAAARAEELAELRGGLAAAQGEMHEMRVREKMHKALVSQMDAVERQRRLLDDEVGRLSEELRAAREREAGQTERARSEAQGHEELGRQHLQLQSEVAHLRDQLDRRDAEAACLRRELEAQAEERAEETRLTLEELGGLRANVDEQDKRCTEQLRDLEGVRAELRQALGERDALGTELELARKDASAGLAAARAERERHEESLRRQLDGALADAATARAERQAAREELTAAREELTAAHELAAAREAAGNETMTELERARQGLLEARSEASAARAEAQRLGPELEAASAGLEAARAELAAARSEARETAQEGEELRRQLDGALSGGEAIHAELLELRDRVAQHQLLEVELRSHRRREREYQDLQQEVLRKCTQLNAIRNKHVEQASPGPPPVAVAATAVASATTTTEGGVTRMTSTTETRVSACGEAEARVAVEELTPDSHADLGGLAAAR